MSETTPQKGLFRLSAHVVEVTGTKSAMNRCTSIATKSPALLLKLDPKLTYRATIRSGACLRPLIRSDWKWCYWNGSGMCAPSVGKVIAIDGKSVRGSGSLCRGQRALHVVSAYASEMGFVLGQQRCEEKSNEITAIEALLPNLALSSCIVTIDAMGVSDGDCRASDLAQRRLSAQCQRQSAKTR